MELLGAAFGAFAVFWIPVAWIASAFLAADFAGWKGRSTLAWFTLTLVGGPWFALLAGVAPDIRTQTFERSVRAKANRAEGGLCPRCREQVRPDMMFCTSCGAMLK